MSAKCRASVAYVPLSPDNIELVKEYILTADARPGAHVPDTAGLQ